MAVIVGAIPMEQAKDFADKLLALRQDSGSCETRYVVDQNLTMESRDAAISDDLAQLSHETLFLDDREHPPRHQ